MTDEYYFDENQPRKVRIKISVSAEMSLLTLKKPESYAVGMSSITLSLGVEFTNSYHEHVHSTSHFDAHFSGFWFIIDAF